MSKPRKLTKKEKLELSVNYLWEAMKLIDDPEAKLSKAKVIVDSESHIRHAITLIETLKLDTK